MHFRYTAVENIVRKGESACNKRFLFFSQCFLPYMALIFHFKCTLQCRLQFVSIWTSLKFCRLVMRLSCDELLLTNSQLLNLYPRITKLKLHPRGRSYKNFGSPASQFLHARCRKCASITTQQLFPIRQILDSSKLKEMEENNSKFHKNHGKFSK